MRRTRRIGVPTALINDCGTTTNTVVVGAGQRPIMPPSARSCRESGVFQTARQPLCDCARVTAQFTDLVVHDGYEFCLCGVQGESLFDPADAGLRTHATSTGNYRGYIARYDTLGGRLYLDSLVVGDKATIHD